MNISALAELPSADVMAPAAVATRRIPPRSREDARGSGPRCALELWPAGPPAIPERGTQRGGGRAGLLPAPRLGPNGERLREAGAREPAHGLGEPAPSVGFKRPLSAPRLAEHRAGLGPSKSLRLLGRAWLNWLPLPISVAGYGYHSHLRPLPRSSSECPQALTNGGPRIGRGP